MECRYSTSARGSNPDYTNKSNNDEKFDKDFVTIKLRRGMTSENLDLNKFKMALFYKGYPEEFLLFIQNLNMTLEASGTLKTCSKIQYLHTLVHGEALHHFYALYAKLESAIPETLAYIIVGLGTYFFLLMRCPSKRARCTAE